MYSRPDEAILSDRDNGIFNTLDLLPIALGNESIDFNSTSTSAIEWNMNKIYVFADDGTILTKEQLSQVNWEKPQEPKKTNAKRKTKATTGTLDERKIVPIDLYRKSNPSYVFADDGSKLTKEEFDQVDWIIKRKNNFHKGKLGDRDVIISNKTPRLNTSQYIFADNFDTLLTQAEIDRVIWGDGTKNIGKLDDREVIISRKGTNDYRIVFASSGNFVTPTEYARIVWDDSKRTSGKLDERDVITKFNYLTRKNKIVYLATGKFIPKDQKLNIKWDDKEKTRGQLDGHIVVSKEIYRREHPKTNYVFVNTPEVYLTPYQLSQVYWEDRQKTTGHFKGREVKFSNIADLQANLPANPPHSETQTSDKQSFDVKAFAQSVLSGQFDIGTATQIFLNSGGVVSPDFFGDSSGESFQYTADEESVEAGISAEAGVPIEMQAGIMPQVSPAQAISSPFGFFTSQQSYLQKRRLSAISTDDDIAHQHSGDEKDQLSPEDMLFKFF